MATIRTSMPSRLRQLLSGESMIGPSLKVDSEPVKAFIDKVIQSPLHDIAIPLSGFRWEFGKGNFHHWRPLMLHFDTYFNTYLANRSDLLLSDNIGPEDGPFPKYAVIQILRVMQTIFENCHNKSAFDGLEHFKLLLASTDPEVLIAALETLSTLVKINPSKLHGSGKLVGCGSVNSYLLSLAQGWGSKEEGLGLYSCVLANERTQEGLSLFPVNEDIKKPQPRLGSTLYFEMHGRVGENVGGEASCTKIIHIPDLHLLKEDDLSVMRHCIEQYSVPADVRFSLLTRIRYARAFHSLRIFRLYSKICLLAFIVLVQSNDANDELTSFFANEPEYTNELIRLVRSEETVPGTIRTYAMLALGAQLAAYSASHDRARILSGSSISFAVGNRMILLNVLQKAVISLITSNDPSSFAFVEALLQFYLLHIVSSSASGGNVRGSGMVPTFLPLLEDSDPNHLHLVYLAVKALQKLMDYSSSAVSLLRELGGVDLLSDRLHLEVNRILNVVDGDNSVVSVGEVLRQYDDQVYSQKRLIKVLLKALGSATYVPVSNTRAINSHESSLPATLSLIYGKAEKFGGDIYYSAVTVMSEIIHKDPTCFPFLHELGLPDAFLASISLGILPSSKALTCIPNGIGALCLNAKGLEAVKDTSALRFLVDICTSRKYVLAMNEAIVPLANAVEELLRHVSSLRGSGVEIIIEIISKIASFEGSSSLVSLERGNESTPMEMDFEQEQDGHCSMVSKGDPMADGINDEQFKHFCIFHLMVLLHRIMENSETCRLFVEKSGIEALLKLLLQPSIIQSSEGMCIALHSTLVFKGFTQHHSATLARAFCVSLRNHLTEALTDLGLTSGSFLLDTRKPPDTKKFSCLFLVEFLLFLAASKDNRWVSALLAEFGNGSKDVLEEIGHLHREILWELSMLEDSKAELKIDSQSSAPDSQRSELSTIESEDHRFNSFRQFLDPLLRRRTLGWSIESQFFDLINLYRDLGRPTGFEQRLIADDSSSRVGSIHQNQSESGEASSDATLREHDKQKSFHNACCDMVRSISFHVTHLFQELGKAMLLPSRRREDTLNVSPPSKVVACTFANIALDHIQSGGHGTFSGSDVSVSTKCRYYGKVINFIDAILLDRPDSCNPILLNCFYGKGVVQSILTNFNATSQLPFLVKMPTSSPMETDDGTCKIDENNDLDQSWMYGPLSSYGRLLDHLVTSSFILSPFTKHLLMQPLVNGVPFPQDAETFVKVLQSMVLKALLPVWMHPQFADCSNDFISTVISIIRHVYSGVEVKNPVSNAAATRVSGPPPNEAAITTIVEMGFSRSRAEEALRQVGSNSVELAMEWLFSHPEEIQEDDELARALAMSLGNSEPDSKDDTDKSRCQPLEEEMIQLPPFNELLSTCAKLLEKKETLAFSVRDLLVLICSQNDGQYRQGVISFLLEQIKGQNVGYDDLNSSLLCSLFHVLALILHEDIVAREEAAKSGLVKIVLDLLSLWDLRSSEEESKQVPKWVTTAVLAVDQLLQIDQKLNSETIELMTKQTNGNLEVLTATDKDKENKLQLVGGHYANHRVSDEQKALIQLACSCIRKQLPSETMHAVFQLCSSLTKNHALAIHFLENDGVNLLLSLPTGSLFPGFDNVAAMVLRHILEDPQTLQQAMETEIRHKFVAAANRHSNGRFTPRNFLLNVNSVIARDPVVFMRAVQAVCQVEMVGERPYIVLMKDRDKEKNKDREKDKEKMDKEKLPTSDGKARLGNAVVLAGNGPSKLHDSSLKSAKGHRRYPQSFTTVIELLLDSIFSFEPAMKDNSVSDEQHNASMSAGMEIDVIAKEKGKAVAGVPGDDGVASQEASASLAKVGFILKVLTEIVLMYSSAVHVLLRRDSEISGSKTVTHQRNVTGLSSGSLIHHVLNRFIPHSKNTKKDKRADSDWRHKLATRASQFLVASCVRSTEARRRVFTEISYILNHFVSSTSTVKPSTSDIHLFVDLLNDILAARTPTGTFISAEASATFIEVGLVKSLTGMLDVLDLDHGDSSKVVTGLIKALELVTKEHVVSSSESGAGKGEVKSSGHSLSAQIQSITGASGPSGVSSQSHHGSVASENVDPIDPAPTYSRSEAVTDDMEHDQDLDGGFLPVAADDDFMQEDSEDIRVVENGLDTIGIHFEIQPSGEDGLDDDSDDDEEDDEDDEDDDEDEEMTGDGDDEDEDGDEGHNDMEDGVHHLSHSDTDQDDHDIDDDEFDEEALDEDEDEEDEDGVILRLEDNGINVFDHIEVFGRDTFSNDTLHVMPVEIFGSRRQGRTTSIYNLLGRSADGAATSRHPLLSGPSNPSNLARSSERSTDSSSSQLETIFRSLRHGRHGQRFNFWVDENLQNNGSGSSIPQGLEDLLISQLRRPSESSLDHSALVAEHKQGSDTDQPRDSEADTQANALDETNANNRNDSMSTPRPSLIDGFGLANVGPESAVESRTQASEMQFEQNDISVRDVEAVSQESGGSGATLGESLRSLDVEIGSADGHDDGGDRQSSADRVPLDPHLSRTRRGVSFGNATSISGREASLHSVTEVSENSSREADNDVSVAEQPTNAESGSASIDPSFLDALPEELRAEVLSAQQGQVSQPSNTEIQNSGDIDPEFLAALPPDIRAEVLAQQQAQRLHSSHELEGQPVEMDTVSIIATFPSDLREEVLLTSSDAILANLTPALVAEANMLRERFAHRYRNRALFGMYPRSRRGESSRRGEGTAYSLERTGVGSRRAVTAKLVEADGAPLVETESLQAMIRVLQIVQPIYKGPLQKLLLNLCAHSETRMALVKILMDMLMLDRRNSNNCLPSAAEPVYRLFACQNNVMYSRPQSSDGVPPLVSRRVLETLTYLAQNHLYVARILLQYKFPLTSFHWHEKIDEVRGKAVMVEEYESTKEQQGGCASISLLLSLLNHPLYLRSIAHLEKLLNLLEVIINNAEKPGIPERTDASVERPLVSQPDRVPVLNPTPPESGMVPTFISDSSSSGGDPPKSSASSTDEGSVYYVLSNLPHAELRLLSSLLAREGLSDHAYLLVAEVMKRLVAIAPIHCHLFITELANAVQTLTNSAMNELRLFGEAVKALLSTTSSDGAAILRVLQALSSLVSSLVDKKKDHDVMSEKDYAAVLSLVCGINSSLEPLWLELSSCISKIESFSDSPHLMPHTRASSSKHSGVMPPLPAGSQNILPYIESFFVMCEKLHPIQPGSSNDYNSAVSDAEEFSASASKQKNLTPALKVDEKNIAFVKFSERHRKLLNAFIRQNSGLLEKSFSLMLKVPRFIDFDNKRAHFRSKIKHHHDHHHHSPLRISVRRAYILEDSYNQLRMRPTQDLKGRLTVHFQGEEGIDAGGLTREWYQLLSRVIFDKGALLFTTVGNEATFQPNPNSVYQTEHLSYFKFVGRVVGKALFDGQLLDVHFTRSFYKHILGAKVTYHDIEAIDPDYFKNLKWMLENDISDLLDLITFSIDADEEKRILYERTEVTDYELIPGGRNIKVTEENKHQYVDLVTEHRLTTAIRPQINAFLEGFNELIPRDLISIFNDKELELLISGLPDIDLDDMRANTEYSGYSAASQIIQWFWEVVQAFSKEDKARLLQFVTGTSKVPLEGFSALQGISGSQKFQIHKAYGSADHLPSAHTCFNQLDLPEYPSKDHLEERLLLAIHEGNEGFGFG